MPIFDFWCESCNETIEIFCKADFEAHCEKCGHPLAKMITKSHFKLDGTDPAYPTAWDTWAKRHEKMAKVGRED